MSRELVTKGNVQLLIGLVFIFCLATAYIYDRRAAPSAEAYQQVVQGYELVEREKLQESLLFFTRAIQLAPNFRAAYDYRAGVLYRLGRYSEAHADYSQVIEIKPSAEAYYNRGSAEFARKNYQNAIDDLLTAAKHQPRGKVTLHTIHYWVGRSYYQLGELENAERAFRDSIRLWSSYDTDNEHLVGSYGYLGDIAFQKEQYPAAIENYTRAIQIQPYNSWAYLSRAKVYFEQNKFAATIQDLNDALFIDANYTEAIYIRARAFHSSGQTKKAESDFNRLVRSESNKAWHHAVRGCFYVAQDRFEEAKSDFAQAWKGDPQIRSWVKKWVNEHAIKYRLANLAKKVLPPEN